MVRRNRAWPFDFTITWGQSDRTLRLEGKIDPADPGSGPTYDSGGTPGCPACVDYLNVFLVHTRKDGKIMERALEKISDNDFEKLEQIIFERESEDWNNED